MASLINQVVQKSTPSLRIVAVSLKFPHLCDPLAASILHSVKSETNSSTPPSDSTSTLNNPIPQNPSKPFHFYYPSFPHGYLFNPNSSDWSDQLKDIEADVSEHETGDARTLWADSVKKKRKKKMNKHKYKKLRKRLRRKT